MPLLDTPEHIREELNALRLEIAECDSFYKANKINAKIIDILEVCLCSSDPFQDYTYFCELPASGHSTRTGTGEDGGSGDGDDNDGRPEPPPLPPIEPNAPEEHKESITTPTVTALIKKGHENADDS